MASKPEAGEANLLPNAEFIKITGLVEDIFVGEDFQILHNEYFTENCEIFTDGEGELESSELEKRSMERFNVFRTYSIQMAAFLERELKRSLGEDFEIRDFLQTVESRSKRAESAVASGAGGDSSAPGSPRLPGAGEPRPSESLDEELIGMDGEIFDMLLTLKDFARFQELMDDYVKMMKGETPNMDGLVSFHKLEDEEEGDDSG